VRKLVAVLAFLAACAVPRTADGGPRTPVGVTQAISHTVHLDESGCTGVNVGNGFLVTAAHCVPDWTGVGDEYEGGVLGYVDPDEDFAIVLMDDPAYAGTPVKLRAADVGERLFVVGYPTQMGSRKQALTVTDGVYTGVVNDKHEERITAEVYFGNSGGGVWGEDGALLGIAVNIWADSGSSPPMPYAGQAFMVPVARFRSWL
jgi:S1-C subfamily serine protease